MIHYLYGDSTPSPLTTDYIALVRDVFDFAVEALLCETRVSVTMQDAAKLAEAKEAEALRAEAMAERVLRALDEEPADAGASVAGRCAAQIRRSVQDLVRAESGLARAVVTMERARVAQVGLQAQEACARAFEALVLRQSLPDSVAATTVWLEEGGSRYLARQERQTNYGLKWTVGVTVPPLHALSRVLRIDSVTEHLEIEAPEATGWLHKDVKLRRQRFDRLYLTELAVDADCTSMTLRISPDTSSAGYVVWFTGPARRVELLRVLAGDISPGSPYEPNAEDATHLRSVREALVAAVEGLDGAERRLESASLDDTPLHELLKPHVLVQRLIESIAPTVAQISAHSLAPGELSLKKVISESQREEVFASKVELRHKLEPLSAEMRRFFDPLELWEGSERKISRVPSKSPGAPGKVPAQHPASL